MHSTCACGLFTPSLLMVFGVLFEPCHCLFFRSCCLWQRGRELIQVSRKSLLANQQLLQTLRHPTVMMRFVLKDFAFSVSENALISFYCNYLKTPTKCFHPLSSGLLVALKAKRRLSRGKGLRRRMLQRRRFIKRRRLAAQMEIVQRRALHLRRVCDIVHGKDASHNKTHIFIYIII